MAEGADISVAQKHYKVIVKASKHRKAGAFMTICTGVCWSPARFVEAGIIQEDEAVCPQYGAHAVDEGHLFWEWPNVKESSHPAIQKSNRFWPNIADARGQITILEGLGFRKGNDPHGTNI